MRKNTKVFFLCVFLVFMVLLAGFVSLIQFIPSVKATNESFNAVWCYWGDIYNHLADLVAHNTFNLFVWTGIPVPSDHSISYAYSDAEITTMLNTIRAYDSSFKIYAWIGSYPHNETGQIDLSTSEYRQAMINSMVACVNKGFDGIQDDIEDIKNSSVQNIADYYNAETAALHAINKKNVVYFYGYSWYLLDLLELIQADYVTITLYSEDSDVDVLLKSAISPCLINISPDVDPFSTQLAFIDDIIAEKGPYPNLAGFAIYHYGAISSENWAAWDSWSTKDQLPDGGGEEVVVVDSYSETNADTYPLITAVYPAAGNATGWAQSFTCSEAKVLTSCKFYLMKFGSPVGNLRARLYAHSGTYGSTSVPTGTPLDESDSVAMASLSDSALALFTFTFSGGYVMQAGAYYCIVIYANDATTLDEITNYIYCAVDHSTPTHSGNLAGTNADQWYFEADYDLCFYVYGSEGAPLITYFFGVPSSIIGKINGVPLENITKVNGVP